MAEEEKRKYIDKFDAFFPIYIHICQAIRYQHPFSPFMRVKYDNVLVQVNLDVMKFSFKNT